MLETHELLPLQLDSDKCVFGQCAQYLTPSDPQALALWKKVNDKHRSLHESGKKAYAAISRGNYDEASSIYKDMQRASAELTNDIEGVLKLQVKGDFTNLMQEIASKGGNQKK